MEKQVEIQESGLQGIIDNILISGVKKVRWYFILSRVFLSSWVCILFRWKIGRELKLLLYLEPTMKKILQNLTAKL